MAGCSSRFFAASDAVDFITADHSIENDERFAGLLDESDDEFQAMGDYIDATTGETLITDDFLSSSGANLILHANGDPDASEMDSLLNYDLDCANGNDKTMVYAC